MVVFPIHFDYNGHSYTANVQRIGSGPVQYHVHSLSPNDYEDRDFYIFSVDKPGKGLEWGFQTQLPKDLLHQIAVSILAEVHKKRIPLADPNYMG